MPGRAVDTGEVLDALEAARTTWAEHQERVHVLK